MALFGGVVITVMRKDEDCGGCDYFDFDDVGSSPRPQEVRSLLIPKIRLAEGQVVIRKLCRSTF